MIITMIVIIIMILIHKSREKKTETCSIRKGKYITGHMAYFDKFLNASIATCTIKHWFTRIMMSFLSDFECLYNHVM